MGYNRERKHRKKHRNREKGRKTERNREKNREKREKGGIFSTYSKNIYINRDIKRYKEI